MASSRLQGLKLRRMKEVKFTMYVCPIVWQVEILKLISYIISGLKERLSKKAWLWKSIFQNIYLAKRIWLHFLLHFGLKMTKYSFMNVIEYNLHSFFISITGLEQGLMHSLLEVSAIRWVSWSMHLQSLTNFIRILNWLWNDSLIITGNLFL